MKNNKIIIEQVAEFNLALSSNVDMLVLALNKCGYMTKIYTSGTASYEVIVYRIKR